MAKLPLSLILALFLVKATVAAPSTEARFKDEAESGKTQEHPHAVWTIKYMTKIKNVVMETIENIENWKSVAILKQLKSGIFMEELASLKASLTSGFDGVITDVQNKFKGGNQETAGTSPLEEIADVKETIQPPVGTSEIEIIGGRAFVFEHNTTRGFMEATQFCKGFNGRLFEPQTQTLYDKIVKRFEEKFSLNNRGFWIGAKYMFRGVKHGFETNGFRYISTKKELEMKKVKEEDRNSHEFCVWAEPTTQMKDWRAKSCNYKYPGTICEIPR